MMGLPKLERSAVIALTVACALLMENLDGTVIATALPQIAQSFDVSPVHLSLAITSYLLSVAIFIPATDRRRDQRTAPEHRGNDRANAKPHKPQQQKHGHQHRNGKHQGRKHPERRADQPQHRGSNQRHRHDERPASAHNGEIGAVAFMQQPKRGPRPHSGGNAAHRAPR
jgi:hypothetical protein